MSKFPAPKQYKNALTADWKLDEFITELKKRSIEHSLGVDGISKGNCISFNIRHRSKDKELIKALLKALFGTIKQG
jgi:hypothetical protein